MQQILHTYKLRLTNLSQANRSLKLARLSKRRDMDLKDLGFLEKDSAEEILARLISGKDIRLINRLDPRFEPTNLADRRLNQIYRTVNTIFEETGTYDLFVGYPFVEGKFIDETVARCPVLLFPARLIRNLQSRPRWQLQVIKDEPVVFNKTFFLAYEQFQQVRIKPAFWEEEIEPSNDWREWVQALYQKIKEYELEINFNSALFDLKLEQFPDLRKEAFDQFKLGTLTFKPQAVLGIFPQSDSALLQDYKVIEQQPAVFDLEGLMGKREPVAAHDDAPYIKEENRFFVTPVDQSQEAALLRIKQGQSLVIHGPPGTGKSQVIVNIIADALAHNKRVLVVSQKRAALDVVYKRLSAMGLGRFGILVHDYRHDRIPIYRKIKQQIEDIDTFKREINDLNITRWEHDYNLLSRQADQLTRQFDELNTALTHPQDCGRSVHELYLRQNPEMKPFPLQESARELTHSGVEIFLEKLGNFLEYADFFDADYPWSNRLSFRHYTYDDLDRLAQKLAGISDTLQTLHTQFEFLAAKLGNDLLNTSLNQQHIDVYNQIHALLHTPQVREDIEALYLDELEKKAVKSKFKQLGKILDQMEDMKILDTFPWTLYSNLKKHVEVFKKQQGKTFRFLRLDYLRAHWFLRKILEGKELKLNDEAFTSLYKEFKLFSKLHWHYVRIHEKAFYSDFPLLESLEEKQNWLVRKQNHFEAFRKVDELKAFPQIKPSFSFGRLEAQPWQESRAIIAELTSFTKQLAARHREWGTFLHAEQIKTLHSGITNQNGADAFLERLQTTFNTDRGELQILDRMLADLTSTEQKVLEILKPVIDKETKEAELIPAVRNSFMHYWIEKAERMHPILAEVSSRSWPRKAKEYEQKLTDRRRKVTELIDRRIKEQIVGIIEYNRLKNPVTYRQIQHQVSKKRRLWSVRKLVQETWRKGLRELTPCWMASPESAAAIFPMGKDFFDVVVFDEASQCFVERAIPVLLRSTQAVIAGDDKQLQPLDLYKVRVEEAEGDFVEDEIALEVESVLDLAKTTFEEAHLTWHYRSIEEELINFSNHAFYEGKLQVIPPATHNLLNIPPLEWIAVQGEWRNNRNLPEARRVVDLILTLIQREDSPSIGVVTFNFHQQELIKDLLDEKLEELVNADDRLYRRLHDAMHKSEAEAFMGIFVKNIENVQGDERDIIIFSIGYAPNENGKLVARFGLLNQRGGENRLNVAITRARQKSYLVCSFQPESLHVENAANDGPRYLKSYLRYAKAVSDNRPFDAISLLNQQHETDITIQPQNPIADYIADQLISRGYEVLRNVGDTSYKLDIAVKDQEAENQFLLGIECEGSHYFSGATSKEREVYRPGLLKTRGWTYYRVWARNFWRDRGKEIEKIVQILEKQKK